MSMWSGLISFKLLTLHPSRLHTSILGQNLARHCTALVVMCGQPLLIEDCSLGHPRARASTPFSVMLLHQDMLMCVSCGHPSLRAFNERSEITEQESRLSLCSFEQCLLSDWQVLSEIFLQPFKFKSSILGHNWARVFIEPSAIDWHPRRESCRKKPPHLRDMFSIMGPYKNSSSHQ